MLRPGFTLANDTNSATKRNESKEQYFPESEIRSASFRRLLETVRRLARDPRSPILIEGESGTGKTLLARRIHASSPRAERPFIRTLLSAIDDSLAGSELFGHVAGAFTDARERRTGAFASAHGGTLFLDEIAKATSTVQHKLLHAIEYGEIRPLGSDREIHVDVRVVAASNVPLAQEVLAGRFISDLNARLENFRIRVPSLRERRADIPVLVSAYLNSDAVECGYVNGPPEMQLALMAALQRGDWPNNLRQLHGTVRRLLLEAEGAPEITFDHCRDSLEWLRDDERSSDGVTLEEIDRAMSKANDNASLAARLLGIDRTTLYRRRRRLSSTDDQAID